MVKRSGQICVWEEGKERGFGRTRKGHRRRRFGTAFRTNLCLGGYIGKRKVKRGYTRHSRIFKPIQLGSISSLLKEWALSFVRNLYIIFGGLSFCYTGCWE